MTWVILPGGIWAIKIDWWATPDAWTADPELLTTERDRLDALHAEIRRVMANGASPHTPGHPAGVYWCEKCSPHPASPQYALPKQGKSQTSKTLEPPAGYPNAVLKETPA